MFKYQYHDNVFGVDVGFETLKVVQLEKKLGRFQVWGKIEIPLPPNAVNKSGILHIQEITKSIKEELGKATPHPITGKKIFAALPESLTFTKTVVLPLTKKKEIEQSILIQAADLLPVSPEEVYLDFVITKQGVSSSEVLLLAQDKKLVDSFTQLIDETGLRLVRLETKQIALARLLLPPNSKESIIIADIGAKVSKVSLFEYGALIATSTAKIGAQMIQSGQTVDLLIEAIRSLPQFRANQTRRPVTINEIKLTGAGALIAGLTDSLQVALNVDVATGSPYLPIEGFEPEFAVATGLALDGLI